MKKYLLFLVMPLFIAGCHDKKNGGVAFNPNLYLPGTTGSYWIYQEFRGDTTDVNFEAFGYDSMYIASDAVINNTHYRTYANMPVSSSRTLRDSANMMIDEFGNIFIANPNHSGILKSDTIWNNSTVQSITQTQMVKDVMVSTPAGAFITPQLKKQVVYDLYAQPTGKGYITYDYAENIGMVLQRVFYSSNSYGITEYRLVRYHLE